MTYRWTGSHAFRDHANDRVIDPGEELPEDIAEQVASSHPYDVDRVDEDTGADSAEDDDVEAAVDAIEDGEEYEVDVVDADRLPFNPESLDIPELEEPLSDVDSEATLEALRNLEKDQRDRKGAKEAIDARLDELTE